MRFFKKSDLVIAAVLLALGIGVYLVYDSMVGGADAKAEIYYYSDLAETIELRQGQHGTFSIPEDPHVVFELYEDGSVAFIESDCPDKVCIHTGPLDTVGEYAACLPNGIVLKIVPAGERTEDDHDIVVGR